MDELPDQYTSGDLRLVADDGKEIGAHQRVRLTGNLRVRESRLSANGFSATLDVTKIEQLEDMPIDFASLNPIEITKANLMDTTLADNALSYVQGKLSIPTMLFMDSDISLNMAVGGQELSVSFMFGTGPNQIEDIPKDYEKSDFKIHDHTGKLINLNKPVKLYGNRSKPKADSPGTLYVEHVEQ